MREVTLPEGLLLKPVPGSDELVAFRYPFQVEGKAVDGEATTVTENDEGDLIIEGYAATFDGLDRQGENFADGAFTRGVKAFLEGPRALCFHHKHDHVIGEVLDLRQEEGKGLFMRARVDYQPESSPLRWIYNAVKKRSLKGLSVGGYFKRAMTELGRRIVDVDMTELSITGVPVHTAPRFAVIGGKALEDMEPSEETDENGDQVWERFDAAVAEFKALVPDPEENN